MNSVCVNIDATPEQVFQMLSWCKDIGFGIVDVDQEETSGLVAFFGAVCPDSKVSRTFRFEDRRQATMFRLKWA